MFRRAFALLVFVWLPGALRLARAEEIAPPLGVEWGEQKEHIERRLQSAKAKVVERRVVNGRDAWTVEGLAQANLRRTLFYFRGGGLVEVEFQYQNDKWAEASYNELLGDLRQRIEKHFGDGKLIARSKTPGAEVTQTLVGYEWNKNNAAIQLIYFAAESAANAYRTLSLHYKTIQ